MARSKKKYTLIKTITTFVILGTISTTATEYLYSNILKDSINEISNPKNSFEQELTLIANEDNIIFSNQELYNILSSKVEGPLTNENIKTIKELSIQNPLTNQDLQDLKYVTNLEKITIENNTINLKDLEYNQNLKSLSIKNSTFYNTSYLPNTIERFFTEESTCNDNCLTIPYNTMSLIISMSNVRNLVLKNPHNLISLVISGDSYIDLNSIIECDNLTFIDLLYCTNISNASILTSLPSLKEIKLDDYAAIWLDSNTLNELPLQDIPVKKKLNTSLRNIDNIIKELNISSNDTEEQIIEKIILYLIENYEYNESVTNQIPGYLKLVENYNDNPITTSFTNDEIICINYTCLFKSLANRLNINSYVEFSTTHAWNVVNIDGKEYGYDITNIDNGTIIKEGNNYINITDYTPAEFIKEGYGNKLYFYEFNLDELSNMDQTPINKPEQIKNTIINLGYIKKDSNIKLTINGITKNVKLTTNITIFLYLSLLTLFLKIILKNNKKDHKLTLK